MSETTPAPKPRPKRVNTTLRVLSETYCWLEAEAVRWTASRGRSFRPCDVAREILDRVAANATGAGPGKAAAD